MQKYVLQVVNMAADQAILNIKYQNLKKVRIKLDQPEYKQIVYH